MTWEGWCKKERLPDDADYQNPFLFPLGVRNEKEQISRGGGGERPVSKRPSKQRPIYTVVFVTLKGENVYIILLRICCTVSLR